MVQESRNARHEQRNDNSIVSRIKVRPPSPRKATRKHFPFLNDPLARLENSRLYSNAIMHPDSPEAIAYREMQKEMHAEIKLQVEQKPNVPRGAEPHEINKTQQHSSESFRKRLVDFLMYLYLTLVQNKMHP